MLISPPFKGVGCPYGANIPIQLVPPETITSSKHSVPGRIKILNGNNLVISTTISLKIRLLRSDAFCWVLSLLCFWTNSLLKISLLFVYETYFLLCSFCGLYDVKSHYFSFLFCLLSLSFIIIVSGIVNFYNHKLFCVLLLSR